MSQYDDRLPEEDRQAPRIQLQPSLKTVWQIAPFGSYLRWASHEVSTETPSPLAGPSTPTGSISIRLETALRSNLDLITEGRIVKWPLRNRYSPKSSTYGCHSSGLKLTPPSRTALRPRGQNCLSWDKRARTWQSSTRSSTGPPTPKRSASPGSVPS